MQILYRPPHFFVQSVLPQAIKLNGDPVREFLPGWHPKLVYAGLAPVYLLLFEHDGGASAIWFLDSNMNHLGGVFSELASNIKIQVMAGYCKLFDGVWNALVDCSGSPRLNQSQRSFFRLPIAIRHQMLNIYLESFDFNTKYETTFSDFNILSDGKMLDLRTRSVLLETESLNHIFHPEYLQNAYLELLRTNTLAWPSLIDGRKLEATHAYYLEGNRYAYKIIDAVHDVSFYVIADEIHFRVACIYIPQKRLALAPDSIYLQTQMPDLSRAIFHHVVEHGEALEIYLQTPTQEVMHAWRGITAMHLGHVLWNDISGIGGLVASLTVEQLPRFLVFDSGVEPEMYGPLDKIFPELEGKMIRDNGPFHEAIPSFYRNHILLIKATGMQVSRSVRDRISDMLTRDPDHATHLAECRKVAERGPVIILGLRTENRTLTDLPGFCERLVEFLIQRADRITLVVDGHNSRSGGRDHIIRSHGETETTRSPMVVELEIVSALERAAEGSNVNIISAIGAPLSHSLIWGYHSDFFVTLWGAGLAKYRWACNLPGLVITSQWNLQNLGDLHIYDDPRCQEDPAPIEFIDQSAVFDRPEAPLLVQLGSGHIPKIMNFDVDEQVAFGVVAELLHRYTRIREPVLV